MSRLVVTFVQGLFVGIANVIPGVSGGTMALLFGIYEAIVEAMSRAVSTGMLLLRGRFGEFGREVVQLPWSLLLPLGAGMVIAPVVGAGIIESLLETEPVSMRGLFFGLIAGSLLLPWLRTRSPGTREHLLALFAAVAAYLLVGLPPREIGDPAAWQIVAAAAFAISAMVLPGVSGAFLLVVLGMYAPTLRALDSLDIGYISLFAVGAGAGLAAFAVLLNWLLKNHHDPTMAVLVGLMAGSLRALWPWQSLEGGMQLPDLGDAVLIPVVLAVVGTVVSGVMTWWEWRRIQAPTE